MNKSELIRRMAEKLDQLTSRDVDLAVHAMIEMMSDSLANGGRIEIRGFGTFANHYRKPRTVRNPRTGEMGIHKPGKFVPHFKPGKDLKKRVDESRAEEDAAGQSHRPPLEPDSANPDSITSHSADTPSSGPSSTG